MKRFIALLTAIVMLLSMTACGTKQETVETPVVTAAPTPEPTPEPTPSPSELWQAFDEKYFISVMSRDYSTLRQYLSDPSAYGIDPAAVPATLGGLTKEDYDEEAAFIQGHLDELALIDREQLTEQEQIAYDTVKKALETELLMCTKYYGYEEVLIPYAGLQADLPLTFFLTKLENKLDIENYLSMLEEVAGLGQQVVDYQKYRAELGIFMSEESLELVLEQIDEVLDNGDDFFLYHTFDDAIAEIEGLTEDEIAAYQARNDAAVKNSFLAGYQAMKDGLEALEENCRPHVGISELPNKTYLDYYYLKMKSATADFDYNDEEAINLYLKTFNVLVALNNSAYQFLGDSLEERQLSVGTVEENMALLHEVMDPLYPAQPELNVNFSYVPEELKDILSAAAYLIPAFDTWQDNTIILNAPEEDQSLLLTLAHEGIHGHMFQLTYHRAMEGLSKAQQLNQYTSYSEAWSQIAEFTLASVGTEEFSSPELMLYLCNNLLSLEMIAYLSIEVNAYGLGKEDTVSYLVDIGYHKEAAERFYDLCITMPFYYTNYAYGFAKLLDIMSTAAETLGEDYDKIAFLEEVLSYGPTTFDIIDDQLELWYEESTAAEPAPAA